ncbi:hypothetical protein [Actinoplanes subglobosus]|uniref:Rad50/SbcC-type AAA domain-containing protein n=1 Tax=Actinoplanes subglobosus TaxID=1547892 RepID=A0ABV8J5B9_9ACTN
MSDALPRPVRLHRLRISGVRTVEPLGPFDREFVFGPGLTVLAADNLRGKTSVFELITWCLRGSPRPTLQGVVRRWIGRLECDAVVAGRHLGFRLTVENGELVDGRVLTAGVPIIQASDPEAFAAMVETLMMELLHLERLESRSTRATSGRTSYGWKAYFGALYLPPGGDPALLGDVVMGGLAGRLLQVFLDLPGAALLTRVRAARDQLVAARKSADDDAERLRTLVAAQREAAVAQLAAARTELASLDQAATPVALASEVSRRSTAAVTAEADFREARERFELLRRQRQADQRLVNDLREHGAARLFFHGLDPAVCPRCEVPISPDRRAAERSTARCAVCTEPAGRSRDEQQRRQAAEEEARWRLSTSRDAEKLARRHLDETNAARIDYRSELAAAERALGAATDGGAETRRRALAERIARLEGAVAAWESLPVSTADGEPDDLHRVLDTAVELLTEDQANAGDGLFGELDHDVAALARTFGFRNLDRVVLDRAGRMQVYKTGGPREWFGTQSPGERLRLRIALVVALLRLGHRHGIATHPGLLLIDSPRSEEVQDDNAAALLCAIEELCQDTPGLQILVTTADERLARENLRQTTIISPDGPGLPLW